MTFDEESLKDSSEVSNRTNEFVGWPVFGDDEIAAVQRVLSSGRVNYWTGDECRAFEHAFAAFVGSRHAVALANGTVALELALRATGIEPGDEVVVPARSFVATASCVVVRDAIPLFADVDEVSQNVTADTIQKVLTPRTRAVIIVHLSGLPCDMGPIMDLVQERNLLLIEDCAQALGASYRGRSVGSFGTAAAWSFCQDKIMTTGGEGGMLTTNTRSIWEKAWSFKDHGKVPEAVSNNDHPPGYRWVHGSIGSNLRMTEMQAAIGNAALPKVDSWVRRRRHLAALLDEGLKGVPGLTVLKPTRDTVHAYYRYHVLVDPDQLKEGWDRDRIMLAVTDLGTNCYTGVCPEIYREAAFADRGLAPPNRLEGARFLAERTLMLQLYPTLTDETIRRAAEHVRHVMKLACR